MAVKTTKKHDRARKGPARLPSPRELERLLPHDERLPRRVSVPPRKKHVVITVVLLGLLFIALILFAVLRIVPWQFKGDDAVVINGERISIKELDMTYNTVNEQVRAQYTRERFLNETIIPQMLIIQEAKKRGIVATEGELQVAINELLATYNFTNEQLDAQLGAVGLDREGLARLLEKRILIVKLLNATVPPQDISEEEIASFFEANKEAIASSQGNVTLQDVHDSIKGFLLSQKQQNAIMAYVEGLRANATIVHNPKAFQ